MGKQIKVKVKGNRYIVAINYRGENQTVNFTLGNLVISSDTRIYSFSDSRILRTDTHNSFLNLRLLT